MPSSPLGVYKPLVLYTYIPNNTVIQRSGDDETGLASLKLMKEKVLVITTRNGGCCMPLRPNKLRKFLLHLAIVLGRSIPFKY